GKLHNTSRKSGRPNGPGRPKLRVPSVGSRHMCGIVGLFCKSPDLEPRLGEYLASMLEQMSDRGPDSAGVAVYRDPAPSGSTKLTLYSFDPAMSWGALSDELASTFGG